MGWIFMLVALVTSIAFNVTLDLSIGIMASVFWVGAVVLWKLAEIEKAVRRSSAMTPISMRRGEEIRTDRAIRPVIFGDLPPGHESVVRAGVKKYFEGEGHGRQRR